MMPTPDFCLDEFDDYGPDPRELIPLTPEQLAEFRKVHRGISNSLAKIGFSESVYVGADLQHELELLDGAEALRLCRLPATPRALSVIEPA